MKFAATAGLILMGWAGVTAKPEPEQVGVYGSPQFIRFEGVQAYSAEEIQSGLSKSGAYVLASHPEGPFGAYLDAVAQCLRRGYRGSGFVDPGVSVSWDPDAAELVAKITEGKRYQAGEVRIVGASKELEALLRERLLREEQRPEHNERLEASYKGLQEAKALPPSVMKAVIAEAFPDGAEGVEVPKADDGSGEALWEPGKWANFTAGANRAIMLAAGEIFSRQGRLFAELEVEVRPRATEELADLIVTVGELGPPSVLGKVQVTGNVINSDKELLRFLELDRPGRSLAGDFVGDMRRKLLESGRFLGYHVLPYRANLESAEVNLLVHVVEFWEAPPVAIALTPEQEALLRFAKWLNSYDGSAGDLVCVGSGIGEEGGGKFEVVLGAGKGLFGSVWMDGKESHVLLTTEQMALVVKDGENSFFGSTPGTGAPIKGYLRSAEAIDEKDGGQSALRTGTFNFGLGIASLGKDAGLFELFPALDPASAVGLAGSYRQGVVTIVEGVVRVKMELGVLTFEEASGQFIELTTGDPESGGSLELKLEAGALARGQATVARAAEGLPNLFEGRSASVWAWSLGASLLDYYRELSELGEVGPALRKALWRFREWVVVAARIDTATAGFLEGPEADDDGEDAFEVPFDYEDALVQGGNLAAVLSMGIYEMMADYLKPGTWPDRVLREAIFLVGGRTQYFDLTVQDLLDDDSIGPFGCLLCARLAGAIGHGSSLRFLQKGRTEMNADGFAKDWALFLREGEEDNSPWEALSEIGKLGGEDLERLLEASPPEKRESLRKFLADLKELGEVPDRERLAPVMNGLWESILQELAKTLYEQAMPKYDPAKVAVVINAKPIPRAFLALQEWSGVAPVMETPEEELAWTVLSAQQIWMQGKAPAAAKKKQGAKAVLKQIGKGDVDRGRKLLQEREIPEMMLEEFVGMLITSIAYRTMVLQKVGEPDPERVEAFYRKNPQLFRDKMTTRVQIIAIKKDDKPIPLDRARNVLKLLKAGGDFEELAKEHSEDALAEHGGDWGWVNPVEEFNERLATQIGMVPDGGTSGVVDDEHYYRIIRVPEPRRQAPLEEIREAVGERMILHEAMAQLSDVAEIAYLDPPAAARKPENEGEPGPEKIAGKKKIDGNLKDLPAIRERAAEGDGLSLYFLGTYHERGVGMERDLTAAIQQYREAAQKGEARAMLRLALLSEYGLGVEQDAAKAREWREQAGRKR